ncbi:uncharacterized protein LOC131687108 [Topomyia yanbarensis]|uniref:uncharacterized protein LOC131687108 n=1 Tax=Topomyia yanbarensis TaxID=2498891 RepID=UPI00273C0C67|nr:uncharacterized protein LOC131687108 [Topomyia yanbarensis]
MAAQNIDNDEFVPGILRQVAADDILYPEPAECGNGQLTICNGCRTIKVCIGLEDALNPTQLCPTSAPFCNTAEGGCSTIPDDTQEQCSAAAQELRFRCTGKGKYPDPHTCGGYYFCDKSGTIGDSYRCPPSYTYNSKVELCQRSNTACKSLNCTASGPVFKVHPSNNKYFYYCLYDANNAAAEPSIIMFSCGDGATYDSNARKCVYKCPREGLYVKSTSPNMYYQCYWSNGRITYIERSCPLATQQFDDTKKVCITPVVNATSKLFL